MDCSWCDRPATYFLLSDRDSHHSVDHACDEHAAQWRHLYRRAVPVPVSGPTQGAPRTVDVREVRVVDLRDAGPAEAGAAVPAQRPAAADAAAPAAGD